jgi:ABC transporter substrate binding protein
MSRRREFITLLGGAVTWPLVASAQQLGGRPARIGFLRASPPPEATMAALRRGLAQQGYEEEKNFILVPGWADGDLSRLPELAKALVTNGVDLILTDGTVTARAARVATATVPIVMAGGLDPIQAGLAESLSRPGGNVTGFTTQTIDVTGKMFEILAETMRGLGRVGVINPRGVGTPFRAAEAKAAQALGLELKYIEVDGPGAEAIDVAMRQTAGEAQAAVMRGTPFFSSTQRKLIVEAAAAHRLPTIYETREFVDDPDGTRPVDPSRHGVCRHPIRTEPATTRNRRHRWLALRTRHPSRNRRLAAAGRSRAHNRTQPRQSPCSRRGPSQGPQGKSCVRAIAWETIPTTATWTL